MATQAQDGVSTASNIARDVPLDRLACAYVDYTVRDTRWIGWAYEQRRAAERTWGVRDGFVLRTCERVEVYAVAEALEFGLAHPLGEVAMELRGPVVFRRLVEIAAGVSSRLLGDRFIAGQVERAGRALPVAHPLSGVAARAVRLARRVRAAHGFAAPADYPDIVDKLLRGGGPAGSRSLVVVGSGMLARTVMTHPLAGAYRRVLPVTRSAKRLRKRMAGNRPDLRICTPSTVLDGLGASRWDVVIATTNLVEPYRTQIVELITDTRCHVAVDVSCVPLLTDPPDGRYHNLYGSAFSALIADQNVVIAEQAERVRAAIRSIHIGRRS